MTLKTMHSITAVCTAIGLGCGPQSAPLQSEQAEVFAVRGEVEPPALKSPQVTDGELGIGHLPSEAPIVSPKRSTVASENHFYELHIPLVDTEVPPQPLPSAPGPQIAAMVENRALVVEPELYERLQEPGAYIQELLEGLDSDSPVMALADDLPDPNGPTALCQNIKIPIVDDECVPMDPSLVDGGSYGPDSHSLPTLEVDEEALCTLGDHPVMLTASLGALSSWCVGIVTLCNPEEEGCDDEPSEPVADDKSIPIEPCDENFYCKWVATEDSTPNHWRTHRNNGTEKKSYKVNGFPFEPTVQAKVGETFLAYGPGPFHYGRMYGDLATVDRRARYGWVTDAQDTTGHITHRINLVCKNPSGRICFPKESVCTASVDLEFGYRSKSMVNTTGHNRVEATVAEKVEFAIGNKLYASRALSVGTGNQRSTSFKAGISVTATGPKATFGHEELIEERSGKREGGLLVHRTVRRHPVPVDARMISTLDMRYYAHAGTQAEAHNVMEDAGLYWVAQSTCPKAGIRYGGKLWLMGQHPRYFTTIRNANDFFKTRRLPKYFSPARPFNRKLPKYKAEDIHRRFRTKKIY